MNIFHAKFTGNARIRFAATEGVKLSGVRKDKDCMPMELWRSLNILFECRRGKAKANLSGKRTKEFSVKIAVFLQSHPHGRWFIFV